MAAVTKKKNTAKNTAKVRTAKKVKATSRSRSRWVVCLRKLPNASQWSDMTPLPKPTILQAVEALSDRDEFKAIVQFIQDERERFFGDLRQCVEQNEVMKIVGSVATLDELLILLKKQGWHFIRFCFYSLAVLFSACLCSDAHRGNPSMGILLVVNLIKIYYWQS